MIQLPAHKSARETTAVYKYSSILGRAALIPMVNLKRSLNIRIQLHSHENYLTR